MHPTDPQIESDTKARGRSSAGAYVLGWASHLPAILFANEHFVAINKPAGWLSVPDRRLDSAERMNVLTWLRVYQGRSIRPIHRLDAPVSGLLLFARTYEAQKAASGWFERRLVSKEYQAYSTSTQDWPDVGSTEVFESRIQRGKKRAFFASHGKPAVTQARFLGVGGPSGCDHGWDWTKLGQWLLMPQTGRPHQLRLELSSRGYPIAGDVLYGSPLVLEEGRAIALRATRLDFVQCEGASRFGLPTALILASEGGSHEEHATTQVGTKTKLISKAQMLGATEARTGVYSEGK